MKPQRPDPLVLLALGGLSLVLEAGLTVAQGTQKQLLSWSQKSRETFGSRLLPPLEEDR